MNNQKTVIFPIEADYAFPNSLKGQRGSTSPGKQYEAASTNDYVRLVKSYFNWNEVERTANDGVDYIREVSDRRFAGCREKNIRFIPRIAMMWPNHGDHTLATKLRRECPVDMVPSTLDTPEFLSRVRYLVEKLGEAWDHDPRVAYMEMGIYGLWGEEHEDAMSRKAQKNMADAFHKAFRITPCMVRYPRDCMGQGFGTYWDSFAHINEEHYARDTIRFMDWHHAVMGGEVAHNWGDHIIQPGDDMNDTLTASDHKQRFLDYVFWQHNNHLGMHIKPGPSLEAALDGLSEYQKRAGHRFVPKKVEYSIKDGKLAITVDIINIGASPLYYNWPMAVALLDEAKQLVWKDTFTGVDIRKWLPGDEWNFEKSTYDIAAKIDTVSETFCVSEVPDGKYFLALAILDPSCGKPNILLATTQYFMGGWHPMGYVGVNTEVSNPEIHASLFQDQRQDNSIQY